MRSIEAILNRNGVSAATGPVSPLKASLSTLICLSTRDFETNPSPAWLVMPWKWTSIITDPFGRGAVRIPLLSRIRLPCSVQGCGRFCVNVLGSRHLLVPLMTRALLGEGHRWFGLLSVSRAADVAGVPLSSAGCWRLPNQAIPAMSVMANCRRRASTSHVDHRLVRRPDDIADRQHRP